MISDLLQQIDTQYIVIFAILLVIFDVFLTQSEVLLWIALSIMFSQVLRFVGVEPSVELWSIPILALVLFIFGRTISKTFSPSVLFKKEEYYVDKIGVLSLKKSTNLRSLFRLDKNLGKEIDGGDELSSSTRYFVTMEDGRQFVWNNNESMEVHDGEKVQLTSVSAGICELVIKKG
jgi:membrane protein implicated in regulation of membrane protease activity